MAEAPAAEGSSANDEVKISRTKTWGSLPTESFYCPDEAHPMDYERDLGDPGTYPFTRGAYPDMYRSRMWTLRHIVGYGTPDDTRDGIERAKIAGATGINVVVDTLTQQAIDPDHPAFGPKSDSKVVQYQRYVMQNACCGALTLRNRTLHGIQLCSRTP